MTPKVHVLLHVVDRTKSREFYRAFFGAAPVEEKPGYVRFLPEWAPANLALSQGGSPGVTLAKGSSCCAPKITMN